MIEGIVGSLIVASITTLIAMLYRQGYLSLWMDNITFYFSKSIDTDQASPSMKMFPIQKILLRYLLHDQSKIGRHRGQFGRSCDKLQDKKWQTKGSTEDLSLKPRMYLTYWPAIVLHRCGLARNAVHRSVTGVESLYIHGKIPLYTSAPAPSPTSRRMGWNLRHTMAGALLLAAYRPKNATTASIVDQMLYQDNGWQDIDGGWWQTSEKRDKPDLWASVYAMKLLDFACSSNRFSSTIFDSAALAIKSTERFLKREWEANKWSDQGKLLTEENLVAMFIDLAPLLRKLSPQLRVDCINMMKSWSSSMGTLNDSFLSKLENQSPPIYEEQVYARMAYAYYLADDESVAWKPFYQKAMQFRKERLFSSELAFLLDLSHADFDSKSDTDKGATTMASRET